MAPGHFIWSVLFDGHHPSRSLCGFPHSLCPLNAEFGRGTMSHLRHLLMCMSLVWSSYHSNLKFEWTNRERVRRGISSTAMRDCICVSVLRTANMPTRRVSCLLSKCETRDIYQTQGAAATTEVAARVVHLNMRSLAGIFPFARGGRNFPLLLGVTVENLNIKSSPVSLAQRLRCRNTRDSERETNTYQLPARLVLPA